MLCHHLLSPCPADEACLQLLCEGDVVGVIVKLMEELPTHYGLQKVHTHSLKNTKKFF